MTFLLIALSVFVLGVLLERRGRRRFPKSCPPKSAHPPRRLFRYDYGLTMGDFLPAIPKLLKKQERKDVSGALNKPVDQTRAAIPVNPDQETESPSE